jgi:hypothetical protein
MHLRNGIKFGPTTLIDGMQKDGLTDAYDNNAMGVCADLCAKEYNFQEKSKINLQYNPMNVRLKHGMKVNLMQKLFRYLFHKEEVNQLLLQKMKNLPTLN